MASEICHLTFLYPVIQLQLSKVNLSKRSKAVTKVKPIEVEARNKENNYITRYKLRQQRASSGQRAVKPSHLRFDPRLPLLKISQWKAHRAECGNKARPTTSIREWWMNTHHNLHSAQDSSHSAPHPIQQNPFQKQQFQLLILKSEYCQVHQLLNFWPTTRLSSSCHILNVGRNNLVFNRYRQIKIRVWTGKTCLILSSTS